MSKKLIKEWIQQILQETAVHKNSMKKYDWRLSRVIDRFKAGGEWSIANTPSNSASCRPPIECSKSSLKIIISPDPLTGEGSRETNFADQNTQEMDEALFRKWVHSGTNTTPLTVSDSENSEIKALGVVDGEYSFSPSLQGTEIKWHQVRQDLELQKEENLGLGDATVPHFEEKDFTPMALNIAGPVWNSAQDLISEISKTAISLYPPPPTDEPSEEECSVGQVLVELLQSVSEADSAGIESPCLSMMVADGLLNNKDMIIVEKNFGEVMCGIHILMKEGSRISQDVLGGKAAALYFPPGEAEPLFDFYIVGQDYDPADKSAPFEGWSAKAGKSSGASLSNYSNLLIDAYNDETDADKKAMLNVLVSFVGDSPESPLKRPDGVMKMLKALADLGDAEAIKWKNKIENTFWPDGQAPAEITPDTMINALTDNPSHDQGKKSNRRKYNSEGVEKLKSLYAELGLTWSKKNANLPEKYSQTGQTRGNLVSPILSPLLRGPIVGALNTQPYRELLAPLATKSGYNQSKVNLSPGNNAVKTNAVFSDKLTQAISADSISFYSKSTASDIGTGTLNMKLETKTGLDSENLIREYIREALLTEAFTKTDERAIETMARKEIDKKWKKEHEKKIDKMFDDRDKNLFRNDAFYKVISRIYQELQRAYAEDQFKYAARYTRKDIPLARFRPS